MEASTSKTESTPKQTMVYVCGGKFFIVLPTKSLKTIFLTSLFLGKRLCSIVFFSFVIKVVC